MPVLRIEFANFVYLWNNHSIRKQKGKDHVVSGKPHVLYYLHPTVMVPDFKVRVEGESWRKVQSIVEQDGINLNEYLPPSTMEICDRMVGRFSGIPQTTPAGQRTTPCIEPYRKLRIELACYTFQGEQPELIECKGDTLGVDSVRTFFDRLGINIEVNDDEIGE